MYKPAPYSRHSRRNATLVMPAIGASTTGGSAITLSDRRITDRSRPRVSVSAPLAPLGRIPGSARAFGAGRVAAAGLFARALIADPSAGRVARAPPTRGGCLAPLRAFGAG